MASYSGCQIFSWVLLVAGTAAIISAISTPYWVSMQPDPEASEMTLHAGLFQFCIKDAALMERALIRLMSGQKTGCQPNGFYQYFKDLAKNPDEISEELQDITNGDGTSKAAQLHKWELVVIALMCASGVIGVLAVVTGPCCCHTNGVMLGVFVMIAAFCAFAGLAIYRYFTETGPGLIVQFKDYDISVGIGENPWKGAQSWSFYAGCAGAIIQLATSILFCASAR